MEPGRRQHLQDIYASDRTGKDEFTPQVSSEIMEERKRDLRRHQMTGFLMGSTILVLAVALVYVVIKEYMQIVNESNTPEAITREYIPRHSLPAESQWVLDFDHTYADPEWDGEGNRPFNSLWLKKAAYNVILAEQSAGIGEFAEAAEFYENALEILPTLEGIKIQLGMAYFKLEKFDEALNLLKNSPDSDLTFDVLNNLGAACIKAKAYDEAQSYLDRSLALKPAYPEALKNQAVLYRKTDALEKAIKSYEAYLDQRPTDTDTRYDFALYLTKAGNWELAGEQLRRLTSEITNVSNLYIILARVETKLGNMDEAMAAMRRATQLTDPSQGLLWMNDSEFDQLRENQDFQALIKSTEKK